MKYLMLMLLPMMLFSTDWMTVVPPVDNSGKEYVRTFVKGNEQKIRSGFKYSYGSFDYVVAYDYIIETGLVDSVKIGLRYNF